MAKNKGLHRSYVWLYQRRKGNKRTLAEMAAEAGVSIEMISKSLEKHGIE